MDIDVYRFLKMVKASIDMNMFCGEYRYSLDSKNRIFIPAKFREILGDNFYIARSVENCLCIYTEEKWNEIFEKISSYPDSVAYQLKKFIYTKSMVGAPDSQGRVIITNDLKAHASLDKNAVIIGVGDRAEIWSEDLWKEQESQMDVESLRELMRQLGL